MSLSNVGLKAKSPLFVQYSNVILTQHNLQNSSFQAKPAIAITEFGFVDKGAHYVRGLLEKGYSLVFFHATGLGDRAAKDLVSQGLFQAFIDREVDRKPRLVGGVERPNGLRDPMG